MKILVGLGNPGDAYCDTRHNAGFMVVESLARSLSITFQKTSPLIETARGTFHDTDRNPEDIILAKPLSFMNRSGRAVSWVLNDTGASVSDILVIHDELDLPLGRIQFK
ncbi:MAG TPA: aminoacyl-tRNA hydrolase, partial [Nitrospiria bacterium]